MKAFIVLCGILYGIPAFVASVAWAIDTASPWPLAMGLPLMVAICMARSEGA